MLVIHRMMVSTCACINGLQFFDKKSRVTTTHRETRIISEDQPLANELCRPVTRKFQRCNACSYRDKIWNAGLVDVRLINKYNKAVRFLLCVIDIYRKYTWAVPVKHKKGISITEKNVFGGSNCNLNKV